MQIRCPQCHVPFDSVEDSSWTDIACPSCGSNFSLAGADATCSYKPGARVLGHFELLEQVGIGRFGAVWKARDTQLQRTVAIKIPRQRDLDPQQTEAFLRDARAAAQLKHPRIAGVHEVGREDQTVYIVTDFIDGANLKEWLTGQQLTSREAAEMVIQIAEALHHAHQAGVIHRDLKPGNIMVDRDGQPHVIDFGLARRESGEMTMTVEGQVLGTPAYMSPEQARGEGHRADRRSDVYSLGVILFELLTGELPFRGQARMLIVQILDEEPPSPRKLNSNVQRDLETVTLKCLEKEPGKRYQTAQDLADDLKRFLSGEPIQARPIGRMERGWRWCRRNSAVASLAAAVFFILSAGIIVSSYFASSASREAKSAKSALEQADLQRKRAEGTNAFFSEEVFGLADPKRHDKAGISLLEALDIASSKIDQRFPDDPELRAVIRDNLGEIYFGIDKPQKAIDQLKLAVDLRTKAAGPKDPATLRSRSNLGHAIYSAGRYGEAQESLRSTLADQTEVLGAGHADAIATARHLSLSYMELADPQSLETARKIAEENYHQALIRLGPKDSSTLDAQCTYSWVLRWQGKDAEALEPARAAAIGLRELKGSEDLRTMFAAYNYAFCLRGLGRNDEAAAELEPLLKSRYRILGRAHVDSLYTAMLLAGALRWAGKPEQGLAVLDDVYTHLDEVQGVKNLRRGKPLYNIALAYIIRDRFDRAADILSVVYKMYMDAQGDEARGVVYAEWLDDLAVTLASSSHVEVRNPKRAIELATKACEATDYKDAKSLSKLVVVDALTGDFDSASKWLDKLLDHDADIALVADANTWNTSALSLVSVAQAGPKAGELAIRLANRACELSPDKGEFENTLGIAYYRAGNWQAAIETLRQAREHKGGAAVASDGYFLAMALAKQGDPDAARRWFDASDRWTAAFAAPASDLKGFRTEAAEVLGLQPEPLAAVPNTPAEQNAIFELFARADPDAKWPHTLLDELARNSSAKPTGHAP